MSEIQLGKGSKNFGIVFTDKLKGGIKREQLKTESQKSIFDTVDIDKNGVLDANEMQQFTQKLQDVAGNDKLTKREAKQFLKQENLKDIDKKELFNFVNQLSQGSENIKESKVFEQNGEKTILITYNDGSQETINPDKTSQVISTDQNNNVTTRFFDENKQLTKEALVQENGDTETTDFQDGQPAVKTVVTNNGTKTAVITYQDGKEASQVIKEGTIESQYKYIDGQPVLMQKVEDLGNDIKRTTAYTYNEDGTVVADITEPGKNTIQQIKDGKLLSEVITEGDKKTERLYKDDSTIQELITQGDNKTATVYNSENKKLEQCVIKDGKQYVLEYDGEGNTKGIIVQNGESISDLAKKFNCSEQQIRELNKDILKGKSYFDVGSEIKIPGELNADDKVLQGRKSADEAKAEFARDQQIREQKRAAKALEDARLKQLGLINRNGAGETVVAHTKTQQNLKLTKVGNAENGRSICKGQGGRYFVVSHDGGILKEVYVTNTTMFANGKKVQAKVRDENGNIVDKQVALVPGAAKDQHGRQLVVDAKGNAYFMSTDGRLLSNTYIQKSNTADVIRKDSKAAQSATMNMLTSQLDSAQAAFDQQMAEDGWAGDVADGISILWGSDNRASKVREDLQAYRNTINELKIAAGQGDDTFKAKFKEKFGIDYNQNAIADYLMKPTAENYRKAFGTKQSIGERVAKYNESQQTGAAVVKGVTTVAAGVAIGIATGGVGLAALGTAAVTTGAASFAINASDRVSSDVGLKDGELTEIAKGALIDGATVLAGGVVGKAAATVVKGTNVASAMTRAGINAAGDVAIGAGTEYMQTGEVTVEGTLINTAMAGVGFAAESGALKNVINKVRHKGSSGNNAPNVAANPDVAISNATNVTTNADVPKSGKLNGRDPIVDGEVVRNINQQHLNANERKIVNEALDDVPTPDELDAYAKEIAYKAPTPEEQVALDAHQEQVKIDYAEANRIENNAVIKERKTSSEVETDFDKLNDEIKGLDGSIKRLKQQIAGAKRFGKNTSKLEMQLASLEEKRKIKADELKALETPKEAKISNEVNVHGKDNNMYELPTSEERMVMGQIGNSISSAKTLEDLAKLQQLLEKMPESEQKTILQDQLNKKLDTFNTSNTSASRPEANMSAQDFSNVVSGTKLPKDQPVFLKGTETLELSGYELDLSAPDVKSKLDAMKNGDVITVGRNGDIKIDAKYDKVSRQHLTIEKTNNGYIVRDTSTNGTVIGEKLPDINPDELCRVSGNNGKPVPSKYIRTSREARAFMNDAIESGSYTKDLESYIKTMNRMHEISAHGKSGNYYWYGEAGHGSNTINPGQIRSEGRMQNRRLDSAKQIEEVAKQYGDPYRVDITSTVKLKGIPKDYLPCDYEGGYHIYPDGKSLTKYYYKEMHRTSKEVIKLINNGASERKILKKLAEHYQYAANARPYGQINNPLFMNEVNTLLSKAGMKGMPQGILDIAAMHLQPDTFKKYFMDQYYATAFN